MKKILFFGEIAMLVLIFVGFALSLAGSIMLALDNAMYDYYNETSRQLAGWLLCMVPASLSLVGGAMYFLRRRVAVLELLASSILFACTIVPFIYMSMYGVSSFILIGTFIVFAAALGTLVITYFQRKASI